jgi:hypothetical protein
VNAWAGLTVKTGGQVSYFFLYFPFFSPLPIFSCIRAKIPVFSYIPVQKRKEEWIMKTVKAVD